MIFVVCISILILGIMFATLATAYIPVETYNCPMETALGPLSTETTNDCDEGSIELEVPISFPIYTVAWMSFIGWILFVTYGGVGLAALPIDLINSFRFRPRRLTYQELDAKKRALTGKVRELILEGERIRMEA
jgi:LMBR1 domain-containing protein 1